MKAISRLFAVIFILSFLPIRSFYVYGDNNFNQYLRVISETTPFYSSPYDVEPLFYLPYSYYVKVLDRNNSLVHVECFKDNSSPSIDGFVPENLLYSDDLAVTSPYPNLTLTTISAAPFYQDSNLKNKLQYIFKDRTLVYYGQYEHEKSIIYYVSYNDKLGYIEESFVSPFTLSLHPNPLTFLSTSSPDEKDENLGINSDSHDGKTLKLLILASLIFAGIIALIFSLKITGKKERFKDYYDENDFS